MSITVAPNGSLQSFSILETFDEAASRAVKTAVGQWRFNPLQGEAASFNAPRIGKLLFRFVLSQGKPSVVDLVEEFRRKN